MKKRTILTSALVGLCTATLALGFTACVSPNNSSSSSPSANTWGTTFTVETAYAKAQELGYSGSLVDFVESISGKDGVNGTDGVGIQSVVLDKEYELIVTLTTGVELRLGNVRGPQGPAGADGVGVEKAELVNGELFITLTNGKVENLGNVVGEKGEDGEDGKPGENGASIAKAEIVDGFLIITLTDGTVLEGVKLPEQEEQESLRFQKVASGYRVAGIGNVSDRIVRIPETYKGLPVTEIGAHAFENDGYIVVVNIPDTVTLIDEYAFSGCTGLARISFGNSVQEIARSAFEKCTRLGRVTIPDSVTELGYYAFAGCTALKSAQLGDGVRKPDQAIFASCTGLEIVSLGDGIEETSSEMFVGCTALKDITFGTSLHTVGPNTFSGCTGLERVDIPDGVTKIQPWAFYGCTGLKEVSIPDSVLTIGTEAFWQCGLTSLDIPDSVTGIGSYAFYECRDLVSVRLGNGLRTVGYDLFNGCESLESVEFGGGVTKIESAAFQNCTSLTSITIPDAVTEIYAWVFDGCSKLENVVLGSGVTSIDMGAFQNTTGLKRVYYRDSAEAWAEVEVHSTFNERLHAAICYYSETEPTETGNFWRYVDGVPTVWENYEELAYAFFSAYEAEYIEAKADARINAMLEYLDPDVGDTPVSTPQILADIETVKTLFASEAEADWAAVAGTQEHYKADYTFTEDWQVYLFNEGIVKTQYVQGRPMKDENGKYITSLDVLDEDTDGDGEFDSNSFTVTMDKVKAGELADEDSEYSLAYWVSHRGCTEAEAAEYVVKAYAIDQVISANTSSHSAIADVIRYWYTGGLVREQFMKEAKAELAGIELENDSVNIIEYYGEGETLVIPNVIEGIALTGIEYGVFKNAVNLKTVYFGGTDAEWSELLIGVNNEYLTNADLYFYSESEPTEAGSYWRYVDGVPTVWKNNG